MAANDVSSPELSDPEKNLSTPSFDLDDKDEALRLVGLERAETFTNEQYLKVRRKLVSLHYTALTLRLVPKPFHRTGLFHHYAKPYIVLNICTSIVDESQ